MDYKCLIKIVDSFGDDLPDKWIEEFVDEDTGEVVPVERTREQAIKEHQELEELRKKAAQEREHPWLYDTEEDAELSSIDEIQNQIDDLEKQLKVLYSDMENDPDVLDEGGEGGPATDEYGRRIDDLEEEIEELRKLIKS